MQRPTFRETHALILFETPQDALRAIEGGVPIKTLNVGSMAHSTGKTMINNVLSMDKEDVATFEKCVTSVLNLMYVKYQTTRKDLFDLIKKATFNNVNLFRSFLKTGLNTFIKTK